MTTHPAKEASLRRRREPHGHARVTFVELFFDLVFVFAVTQLSHTLLGNPTTLGALQTGMLMLAMWWVWIFTCWVTNWLDPERPPVRVMLFALMAGGLALSVSLPHAFTERGLVFGVAFAAVQFGRSLFVLWAMRNDEAQRRNFTRISTWLGVSGALWIAGGLCEGPVRLAVWAVALGIEYLGPSMAFWTPGLGRTPTTDWDVEGGHMAERCGLFIIIALGESILVMGATFASHPWNPSVVAAFASAFLAALAMWWIYFSLHAEAASDAISKSKDPGRIARIAYTYIHLVLVAGIIVTAVADELVLAHPVGHIDLKTVIFLIGGPALFLLGNLLFKLSVFGVLSKSRSAGLALLAVVAAFALHLSPLVVSLLTTGVLLFVAAWESIVPWKPREPVV